MVTQKLMVNAWKLPTGLRSHHAFLLDEVTTRNVANGKKDQAKKTSHSTSHQTHPKPEGTGKYRLGTQQDVCGKMG